MKRMLISLAVLLSGVAVEAKVELSPLFTDNMVFQQKFQAPVCNLFNSAGLPAHPFRTDDWPGVTAGKE